MTRRGPVARGIKRPRQTPGPWFLLEDSMGHDEQIMEAGRKFLVGRGAETLIDEPSVGGGESMDWIGWFRPEEGPYYTEVVELKRSLEDAWRELEKKTPNDKRAGNRRWMLIPFDLWYDDGGEIERIARQLDMGIIAWDEHTGEMTLCREALFRDLPESAIRAEQRILHDQFNRERRELRQLRGNGPKPKRAASAAPITLKPYHHDILHSNIMHERSEKEVAAILRDHDNRLTKKQAAILARKAMVQGSVPGFHAVKHGQTWFLERADQTQETTT